MENAIKIALGVGYTTVYNDYRKDYIQKLITLDPLFWKSLGKAMGYRTIDKAELPKDSLLHLHQDWWLGTWHRFIDHLAEGKDAESFFNELLK